MMQKINTMYVTSQIIWEIKPPFSVNAAHSVRRGRYTRHTRYSRYSRYSRYTRYSQSFLLLTITFDEGESFEIHFTSYIKAHSTCSDDIEDTHRA